MKRIGLRTRTIAYAADSLTFHRWLENLVNNCPYFGANLAQAREGNALKAQIVGGADYVDVQEDVYQALADLAKAPGKVFSSGYVMATVEHAEHLLKSGDTPKNEAK